MSEKLVSLSVGLDVIYKDFVGGTYFRTSDVRPYIDVSGRLVVFRGVGSKRSWGCWSVRSDVFVVSDTVVNVRVIGWHKHTIRPVGGDFYFVRDSDGAWSRRTARHSAVVAALALASEGGQ